MALLERLFVVLVLTGLTCAQYPTLEETVLANQLLSLLQDQQEIIQRQNEEESGKGSVKWDNSFNRPLKVECNADKGEALVRVQSKFSKKDGDRRFKWECQDVTEGAVQLSECEWSKEVNKWNGPISYICPADQVMAGIKSKNHESKEDRKWKVKCCKALGHITKSCRISERLNSYRGDIDYTASRDRGEPSVFVGIQSLENPKNDREWQVFECNFGTPKCPSQSPQYQPTYQYPRYYPPYTPPTGEHSYEIVLDTNKPHPRPRSPPQPQVRPVYRIHPPPTQNGGQYTVELDPQARNEQKKVFLENENSNKQTTNQKRNGPPKLLPVPPGTSKHPEPPPPPRPTNQNPSGGHVIEIVPRLDPPYPPPSPPEYPPQEQPSEKHFHIYPPKGDKPGRFTILPNPSNSGAPKIRWSEPARPPQKSHYHMQLPADPRPKLPPEVHYDVPVPHPSTNGGMGYSVPLVGPGKGRNQNGKQNSDALELLEQLVRRGILQNIEELD